MRPDELVGLPMLPCQGPHFKQRVENLAAATSSSAFRRQVLSALFRFTLRPLPRYQRRESVGVGLRRSGNQVCYRLAVSGYDNRLSMLPLPPPEEFGQAILGLCSLDLTDVDSSPLC